MSGDERPFAGWDAASVGCHWSRPLPDGRTLHMSTWACADRYGYSLTLDFESRVFPDLEAAKAGYAFLARAQAGTSLADVPGA